MPAAVGAERKLQDEVSRSVLPRLDAVRANRSVQRVPVQAHGDPLRRLRQTRGPDAGRQDVAAPRFDDVDPGPLREAHHPGAEPPAAARGSDVPDDLHRLADVRSIDVGLRRRRRPRARDPRGDDVDVLGTAAPAVAADRRFVIGPPLDGVDEILVEPMRGVAKLRSLVHGPGADLKLEEGAVRTGDGGVEGLVPASLLVRDVIVVLAGDGSVELVDRVDDGVARLHLVLGAGRLAGLADDDAERPGVAHLAEVDVLPSHLEVRGVGGFQPPGDLHAEARGEGIELQRTHRRRLALAQGAEGGVQGRTPHGWSAIRGGRGGRLVRRHHRRRRRRRRPRVPLRSLKQIKRGHAREQSLELLLLLRQGLGALLAFLLPRGGHRLQPHLPRAPLRLHGSLLLAARTVSPRGTRVFAPENPLEEHLDVRARGRLPRHRERGLTRRLGRTRVVVVVGGGFIGFHL